MGRQMVDGLLSFLIGQARHIKYLENHLYILTKESKRYEVVNGNVPTKASISEMDRAEMDEFIDREIKCDFCKGNIVETVCLLNSRKSKPDTHV